MNSKGSGVYWLIANNHVSIFVYKNEIRNTNLGKVLRERIEPEVVCQNGISNRYVASHAFVEASVCKTVDGSELSSSRSTINLHSESSGKMLFAIQSFFLQAVEFGIGTDLKLLAGRSHAKRSSFSIAFGFANERGCNGCHCVRMWSERFKVIISNTLQAYSLVQGLGGNNG
jgi:hypothetical protein